MSQDGSEDGSKGPDSMEERWLGSAEGQPEPEEDATTTRFDPRATGRKREVIIVAGALLLAVGVAGVLRSQAGKNEDQPAPSPAATARTASAADLIARADQALAAGKDAEANELARQALALEASAVDGWVIVGEVEQKAGRAEEAKKTYRKYLELAPFGKMAERARAKLAELEGTPPNP